MSVYCVNSGNTHADLYAAENAEHGQHVGLVIFLVTGFDTSSPVFSGSGYDDVHVKAAGGSVWDGKTSNLIAGVGSVNSSANSIIFDDLAVKYANLANSATSVLNRCFVGYGNTGGTVVSASDYLPATLNNCVIDGTSKTVSSYSGTLNLNKCTVIKANGYGVIRTVATDSAILNTGSATLVQSTHTNTFTDDGAQGSINNLAESDFVDYANGDYRLKADSAAALAGVSAFIEEPAVSYEFDISASFNVPMVGMSSFISSDVPEVSLFGSMLSPPVSLSAGVSATVSDVGINASLNAPAASILAGITSEAPGVSVSAAMASPAIELATLLAGDVPTVNISASFDVPVNPVLSAHLGAEMPEYDISANFESPIPQVLAFTAVTIDDTDIIADFPAPMVSLNAVVVNGDIIKVTPLENIIHSKPRGRLLFTKDKGRYL